MQNKNAFLAMKIAIINLIVLLLLTFSLQPVLISRLDDNLQGDSSLGTLGLLFVGASVIEGVILITAFIISAILFNKVFKIKHYLTVAFIPQLVLALYAWLGQYNWWPSSASRILNILITSTIVMITYLLISRRIDLSPMKS